MDFSEIPEIEIIGSTGFTYYGRGSITFKVGDWEGTISTIHPPDERFVLSEKSEKLNAALISLLNCEGDENYWEDDDENAPSPESVEGAYLELMNEVLAQGQENDGEFDDLLMEIVLASMRDFPEADLISLL